MAWFKVDDGFYTSKKVLSIPRQQRLAAVGLWVMAGNWSARELTDGVVPAYVLAEIGATPRLRQALVTARLWLDHGSAGIEFHGWAEYQPTRAKVEDDRERERIRKEKYRMSHRDTDRTPSSVPPSVQAESQGESGHPDPTRPDPTNTPNGVRPRKRGTRLPEPFIVTREMRDWAAQEVPAVDVDTTTRKFVDYWRAKSGRDATKQDWAATWRNWLRTDAERRTQPRQDKDERALSVIQMGQRLAAATDQQEITA